MARTTDTQAMTVNSEHLSIGLSQIRVAEITDISSPILNDVSGTPSADASSSPMSKTESIGAIQAGGLETDVVTKTHSSGYPAQVDQSVTESTAAVYNITMEELIGTKGLGILDNILDTLDTGTQHYYALESLSMYQGGETGSIYTPAAVLKPELNLTMSNEWGGLPITFEALYKASFTNNKLFYWKKDNTPTSRDRSLQPLTLDPADLLIGEMQFKMGPFATRDAGQGAVYPSRKVVGDLTSEESSALMITSGGTYTGAFDGAYVITITTGGATGTAQYTITDLEGTTGSATTIGVGGETVVVDGVDFVFADTTYVIGDIYVIGVASNNEMTNTQTNIYCIYPYLPSTKSIGSIISSAVGSEIAYKDHFSGYPQKKDSSIMESSEIKFSCNVEELGMTESNFVSGRAANLTDAMLDASRDGTDYFAPLEVVITSVSGKTYSFYVANAKIKPQINFSPSNDWANSPLEFLALPQSGITGSKRVQTLLRA